jgi:uncharacterized protein (DUF1501 family)
MRTAPNRRQTLALLTGGMLAGVGLPRAAKAAVDPGQRRFLFVFVDGGWDTTYCLSPVFDNAAVDMPADGVLATAGGLSWVSGASRPAVDDFFLRYGQYTAIVHGMEVRSIAHERCKRLLFTGGSQPDDFPSLLAAASPEHLPLGHLVIRGPSYAGSAASSVVRIGQRGQLSALLDGTLFEGSREGHALPAEAVRQQQAALVAARLARARGEAGLGAQSRLYEGYERMLDDWAQIPSVSDVLDVSVSDASTQIQAGLELLASGISRCVLVSDRGFEDLRWDHHTELTRQSPSYQGLFTNLTFLMQELERRPGLTSDRLLDEVTVVVFSEMNRFPVLNGSGGKDHWTTTSLMLMGGGIRGDQVVGAYNADMGGIPVVPDTGELDESGTSGVLIDPSHIGATLLHLAGVDPGPILGAEMEPLTCLLEDG